MWCTIYMHTEILVHPTASSDRVTVFWPKKGKKELEKWDAEVVGEDASADTSATPIDIKRKLLHGKHVKKTNKLYLHIGFKYQGDPRCMLHASLRTVTLFACSKSGSKKNTQAIKDNWSKGH